MREGEKKGRGAVRWEIEGGEGKWSVDKRKGTKREEELKMNQMQGTRATICES